MLILLVFPLFLMTDPSGVDIDSLKLGDRAPEFALPWASQDSLSLSPKHLSDCLKEGSIVLAFYPADWSGGCTREMCRFRDEFGDLQALGVKIYGVSGDYPFSHREWAKSLNIPFVLFSDPFHEISRLYGSFDEESGFNRRSVYLIDQDGRIVYMDLSFRSNDPESYNRLRQSIESSR